MCRAPVRHNEEACVSLSNPFFQVAPERVRVLAAPLTGVAKHVAINCDLVVCNPQGSEAEAAAERCCSDWTTSITDARQKVGMTRRGFTGCVGVCASA
jgi:hypothetical protein